MRALHLIKTSDGADWAAQQVKCLIDAGIEVHVILPFSEGSAIRQWQESGATTHFIYTKRAEHTLRNPLREAHYYRKVASRIKPDIIHSHFVNTTLLVRLALGKKDLIPRIFQVPGPLHLEHQIFRIAEISSAGPLDYWIASSEYTRSLYLRAGVPRSKLFLSYYGTRLPDESKRTESGLRQKYCISEKTKIVGNANYFYPPKYYLGQMSGIKGHEAVINSLGSLIKKREDFVCVFIGGQWGKGFRYEDRLKEKARAKLGERVIFTGKLPRSKLLDYLREFDCVVHMPTSENCGGVIESLALGIPTIAARVGGLPEIIIDHVTGRLVQLNDHSALMNTIESVLNQADESTECTEVGRKLVQSMFMVERTSKEVSAIYDHIILGKPAPKEFSSISFLRNLGVKSDL